ncbi:MAG TPA: FecR domain-containing protein, partial [Polyangiaceae bacterium]|nr:FecR domain-containing protein [Polyangiaceae bacterium]
VAAAGIALLASSKGAHSPGLPAVVAILQPTGSGARLFTPSGSEPLRSGSPLPPGGHLVADAHGGAALRLSTGTEIAIEHDASLAFSDAGPTEHFVLSQGQIRAHVAKLGAGERFIVSTPDAEVEVHGTVFSVALAESDNTCGDGNRTRVTVDEGIVEVRAHGQSAFVHPGERWPANCAAAPAAASAVEAVKAPAQRPAPAAVSASATALSRAGQDALSASPEPTTNASRLAQQNDLFSKGVTARRNGDTAGAVAAFDSLLSHYPASALTESAAAERMRALAPGNRDAARAAAKEYLARYPQGFARHDADAILAQP